MGNAWRAGAAADWTRRDPAGRGWGEEEGERERGRACALRAGSAAVGPRAATVGRFPPRGNGSASGPLGNGRREGSREGGAARSGAAAVREKLPVLSRSGTER